jgi:hypothetical protein
MNSRTALRFGLLTVAALTPVTKPALWASDGVLHQPKSGEFVFSLLPKAFQRTPDLEMTVNTEVTPYGRLLRTPTPQQPVYYLAHSGGFKPMGDSVAGEHPPSSEQIDRALTKALATNGYLPASASNQSPSLVIFYFWGSHNRLDRETEAQFPVLAAKHRMERAILVGGRTQLEKMARVLEWGENLTDRTPEYEYLRDQALDDLYFVVASAYDYAALGRNERNLVWRTTMTVNARGVAMKESLNPLIATAAPYFGRDMADPEIATRRISRWGVDVGEDKVIEADVPLPAPKGTPPGGSGAPGKK